MAILLYHDINEDGGVDLSEGIIAGQRTPERHYRQKGHFLEVDPPANAREHDVGELQQLGYRLATPSEQNSYAKRERGNLRERDKTPGSLEE